MDPGLIRAGVGFAGGLTAAAAYNKGLKKGETEPKDAESDDAAAGRLSVKECVGIGCFGAAFCATI